MGEEREAEIRQDVEAQVRWELAGHFLPFSSCVILLLTVLLRS